MADTIVFPTDVYITGRLVPLQFSPPAGSVGNTAIPALAAIDASKLIHRFDLSYTQVPGTAVVTETRDLRILRGATGTVAAVEAAITGAIATGGDRTVTIDVQKGNSATAFTTILTATLSFTSSSVLRTVSAATISVPAVLDNDILRVVVTVAGSAGAQAQGLIVTVTLEEAPV